LRITDGRAMSRVLLVAPPWEGHINPASGIAAVLRSLGHEVAWVGQTAILHRLGIADRIFACDPFDAPERPAGLRGMAALEHLWMRCMLPLATCMDAAVIEALAVFRPDAVLVDQQAIGAALRLHDRGLPWLTLASSPGELAARQDAHASVRDWTTTSARTLAYTLGVATCLDDALFAPRGTLMPSAPALMGPVAETLRVRAIGCLTRHRLSPMPEPPPVTTGSHVLVSLGTVSGPTGARFLEAAWQAALTTTDVHWTIVDPAGSLAGSLEGRVAPNITLTGRIDQLALLPSIDAVLCHGGHNTVAESLLHGCPLVVAPIRDDQPAIAQRVVEAAAGLRLRFAHATAAHISGAVRTVLTEATFRRGAQAIGAELADGEARAASALRSWLADPEQPLA
jgi:UDP:flavonoid glycosyltransferase YjiC (YdhE family)